jgi:hypothetical protein
MNSIAHSRAGLVLGLLFSLSMSSKGSAQDTLIPVPPPETKAIDQIPKNLAREILGASVKVYIGTENGGWKASGTVADPLLSDDVSGSAPFPAGRSIFIVDIAGRYPLQKVTFQSNGAIGEAKVFTSAVRLDPESSRWRAAANGTKIEVGDISQIPLSAEARYVKIELNLSQAGEIGTFGIYSTAAVTRFTFDPTPKDENTVVHTATGAAKAPPLQQCVNLASLSAQGRVAYVSSTENLSDSVNQVDENVNTLYTFKPEDPKPIGIVKLHKSQPIRRISLITMPQEAEVDFYVMPGIPAHLPPPLVRVTPDRFHFLGRFPFLAAAFSQVETTLGDFLTDQSPTATVRGKNGRFVTDINHIRGQYVMFVWRSEHPLVVRDFSVMSDYAYHDIGDAPGDHVGNLDLAVNATGLPRAPINPPLIPPTTVIPPVEPPDVPPVSP